MTKQRNILTLENVIPMTPFQFRHPVNLTMGKGEHWLVFGPNASGKSFLSKLICGSFLLRDGRISYNFDDKKATKPSESIVLITFRDQYGDMSQSPFYQFRWNHGLHDDALPTVADILNQTAQTAIHEEYKIAEGVHDLLNKPVIVLSSGEFRRFQIVKAIINRPALLILDNPFIGLDSKNRQNVVDFLKLLIARHEVNLILNIPSWSAPIDGFTHVVEIVNGEISKTPVAEYRTHEKVSRTSSDACQTYNHASTTSSTPLCSCGFQNMAPAFGDEIVNFKNVTIRYEGRTIIDKLSWSVRQGERWALTGANGSGKSTLLSLICADNPQAYACDITLFGSRRGTGESIWDIKSHIGYVSPEMYRSYYKPLPAKQIVASGMFDTIGFYQVPKDYSSVYDWMERFEIARLADTDYTKLSDGEQRLVLLTRAFVKNPDLLILDEPFHGLDDYNRDMAKRIIDDYCRNSSKTLIMVSHYDEDFPSSITHKLTMQKNN